MLVKIFILVVGVLMLSGCYSKMTFKVDRYDMSTCTKNPVNEACEAETEYFKYHKTGSTLAETTFHIINIKKKVEAYRDNVIGYNNIDCIINNKSKNCKDALIIKEFNKITASIDNEIDNVNNMISEHGYGYYTYYSYAPIRAAYKLLYDELNGKVLLNIKSVRETVRKFTQDEKITADTKKLIWCKLKAAGIKINNKSVSEKFIENDVNNASDEYSDEEALNMINEKTSMPGDSVARPYRVFQDLSDPFWGYIASHTENWKTLPNFAKASDSWGGDSEFILVLENGLDGRWKRINVDPTKVIQARLRIARKTAGAITALVGVAAKAYGVPMPEEISRNGKKGGTGQDEIDISLMSADELLVKKENQVVKAGMLQLQAYAMDTLSANKIDKDDHEQLLDQLIRRLSGI